MAYEFLDPILTPAAQAAVRNDPSIVTVLIIVIFGLIGYSVLCWYLGFAVRKPDQQKSKGLLFWRKGKAGKVTGGEKK